MPRQEVWAATGTFRSVAVGTGLVCWPVVAAAHGHGDFRGVATAIVLFWFTLGVAALFLIYLLVSKQRTLRPIVRPILFVLIMLGTGTLVEALNILIWDRLYSGEYFITVALSSGLLVPAGFTAVLPLFRRGTDASRARTAAVITGVLLAGLVGGWILCEYLG